MVTSFILRLLPLLSDQAVHFLRQRRHFVHALLPGHAGSIGAVGELVGVVAQSRYLAQQICMMRAGAWMKFSTHNQCAQVFFARQAAQFGLAVKMAQFLFIEPQRDLMVSFADVLTSQWYIQMAARRHTGFGASPKQAFGRPNAMLAKLASR